MGERSALTQDKNSKSVRKTIIYVAQNILDDRDGATTHVRNIVSSLSKKVERVILVTRSTSTRRCVRICGCEVIEVATPFEHVPYISIFLWQFIAASKIHAFLRPTTVLYQRHIGGLFLPILLGRLAGCITVLEVNSDLVDEYRKFGNRFLVWPIALLERVVVRLATKILFVSWGIRDACVKRYNLSSERAFVVINGYDPAVFFDAGKKRDDNLLIWVGAMYPWQGLDVALHMCRILKDRNVPCKFVVIGDGPVMCDMVTLSHELRLEDSVSFLGWLSETEVNKYLNRATVALAPFAPGKGEIMALKLFAYAATGTPIVVSDCPGLPQVLAREGGAVLVHRASPREYADAVQLLLEDPRRRTAMGQRLKDWAAAQTWDHRAEEILRIIESGRDRTMGVTSLDARDS